MPAVSNKLIHALQAHNSRLKEFGRKMDVERCFDRGVTSLVDPEGLKTLLLANESDSVWTPEKEAEFFFNATQYCANTRNYFLVSVGMVATTIQRYGSDDQKRRYCNDFFSSNRIGSLAITEPSAGSNIKEIDTRYVRKDNHFIINGEKCWITLGGIADIILLAANGDDGILLFCVDPQKHKFKRKDMQGLLSNRGSHIATLDFRNMQIESEAILGNDIDKSKQALNFALLNGRAIAAISAVSMANAAIDEAISYSKLRKQFGKFIHEHQLIQKLIADAKISICAAQSLCVEAFKHKRHGGIESMTYSSMAKINASEVIKRVTTDSMQVIGANSMLDKHNLERYYREARAFEYIEGTTQILTQLVARGAVSGVPNLWKN